MKKPDQRPKKTWPRPLPTGILLNIGILSLNHSGMWVFEHCLCLCLRRSVMLCEWRAGTRSSLYCSAPEASLWSRGCCEASNLAQRTCVIVVKLKKKVSKEFGMWCPVMWCHDNDIVVYIHMGKVRSQSVNCMSDVSVIRIVFCVVPMFYGSVHSQL